MQNPSVYDPTIEEKIEILHLMESLGIEQVNIGLPGAGARAAEHVEALAREIASNRMKIRPNCAARTVEADIQPIVEISQRVGIAIEAATFLGSSPIRRLVEDWTVDHLERTTEKAVKFAVDHGLPSMYVTEDTIRTDPDTVKRLYTTAIRSGARAIVLCDTVGHATPPGAFNLIQFAITEVVKPSGEKIRVDWHGHNDRGLAIANSLAAVAAGANCVHAAANALGERVGNTPMELMLVNLRLMGLIDRDLSTPEGVLRESRRCHAHHDPAKLSGHRPRRLPHRHRSPRRRNHQGISQQRSWPRRRGLQRRPGQSLWPRSSHRDRPHERQIQRALLARAPQNSRHRRRG